MEMRFHLLWEKIKRYADNFQVAPLTPSAFLLFLMSVNVFTDTMFYLPTHWLVPGSWLLFLSDTVQPPYPSLFY